MEDKKSDPFLVKGASPLVPQSLAKTKPKPKPKSQPLPKAKTKPAGSARERNSKPKTKLEAKEHSLEDKKKLDINYDKGFVKTSRR